MATSATRAAPVMNVIGTIGGVNWANIGVNVICGLAAGTN